MHLTKVITDWYKKAPAANLIRQQAPAPSTADAEGAWCCSAYPLPRAGSDVALSILGNPRTRRWDRTWDRASDHVRESTVPYKIKYRVATRDSELRPIKHNERSSSRTLASR